MASSISGHAHRIGWLVSPLIHLPIGNKIYVEIYVENAVAVVLF